jgi:hypothetical protein
MKPAEYSEGSRTSGGRCVSLCVVVVVVAAGVTMDGLTY